MNSKTDFCQAPASDGKGKVSGKEDSILFAKRYPTMDTDDKVIVNLRELNHTMRALYEGKESQRRILIILLETGPITQRDLTERLRIQPGSASEVIGKLESAGLIRRTPNPADRRTADIHLTSRGMEQAREAARQRKARHREMFSCLSPQEKEALLTLLEKLNTDWTNRYRSPAS